MRLEKLLKRLGLAVLAVVLMVSAVQIVRELRMVRRQYERHPQAFQTVAEYFCSLDLEGSIFIEPPSIWREGTALEDEPWPEEVTAAIKEIFRRSDCRMIYTTRWTDVKYCEFQDRFGSHQKNETGIVYTPADQMGGPLKSEVTDGYCQEWVELSEQWFYYDRLSYYGIKEIPG